METEFVGRRTRYEYNLWLSCETVEHLQSIFESHQERLHKEIAIATGKDHGWPKSMPWQIRLMLYYSSRKGYTPKREAKETIWMYVHQVMKAFQDLEDFKHAKAA